MNGVRLTLCLAGAAAALAGGLWGRDGGPEPALPASTQHIDAAREFWASYREATGRRMKQDFEGAAELYSRALALRPNHQDSLYYLGNCHLERRAYREALQAFQQLVAINPSGSSRAYMHSGLVYASLDPAAPHDLDEARRLFQLALDTDPDSGALLGLAEVALLRHRPDEARELLERANAENPMSLAAPYLLGYLVFRDGARDEAWRLFRMAVDRGELKKPPVIWSEEGDVKADPTLRWRALARQSVFGAQWLRLRGYLEPPDPGPADMAHEYHLLETAIAAARAP